MMLRCMHADSLFSGLAHNCHDTFTREEGPEYDVPVS